MLFCDANLSPVGTLVVLAKVQVGVWCRNWVLYGATHTYKVALAEKVSDVRWNRSTLLTQAASVSAVETTVGSWFWEDGYLYVRATSGQTVFANVIQAVVTLGFSRPDPRLVDGIQYFPRLRSAPNLSQRIESYFGGVGQVGGGSMALENADGYFNDKEDWQWDSGKVEIFCGMEVTGQTLADSDFEQVATWVVEDWQRNRAEFTLQLREPKAKIKAQIPSEEFNRTDYPNIEENNIGQPIPMAYGRIIGAKPVLVDPGTKRFKVAGHEIASLDGVRIKSDGSQEFTKALNLFSWNYYGGGEPNTYVFRTYIPGVSIKNISHSTLAWTQKSSIAEVRTANYGANTQYWYYSEGWLYVGVESINAAGSSLVAYEVNATGWTPSVFETKDLANGEFTLGSDWIIGKEVAVDFTGKPGTDGWPIEAATDVIKDLLESVGETAFDSTDWSTISGERRKLKLGELNGRPIYRRALSLYIDKKKDVLTLLGEINSVCTTYTWTNEFGEYAVGVWNPYAIGGDPLNSVDIIEFSENIDTGKIISKAVANYRISKQEGLKQTYTMERSSTQIVRDQPQAISEERDLPFFEERDAIDWAGQMLYMLEAPVRRLSVTVPWKYIAHYNLGDILAVKLVEKQIDENFEIIEKTVDFARGQVKFVLSDLRGISNKMGWWVANGASLPSSFSTLTGYGSGSVVWNKNWDPLIKAWARNNYGYWCDANGFADSTDPDSCLVSTWI